jgi:peptidoglycan hydrolase-like protein with peptidoglycan-binding domain
MSRRWSLTALIAALALMTAPAASGATKHPPASAGWHGREIRDPLPRDHATGVASFPRGWSAGAVRRGTGYASPHGSRRVREVQRRLRHRGYRPGPVDGRFGPRTRASVLWFQLKHGLPRTGRVGARTLATLRTRHHQAPPVRTTAAPKAPTEPVTPRLTRTTIATHVSTFPTGLLLAGVLLVLGLAVMVALTRRRRPNTSGVQRPDAHNRYAGAWSQHAGRWDARPATPRVAAATAPTQVIGYVAGPADRYREHDAAERIGAWCERHGRQLTRLVHDLDFPNTPLADRVGVAHVLDQAEDGRVAGLVVAHLADLARSAPELTVILHRLDRAGSFIVALDHDLDTTTQAGRRAALALGQGVGWPRRLDHGLSTQWRPSAADVAALLTVSHGGARMDR